MVDLAASGELDLIDEPAREPGRAGGSRVAVDEVAKRRGDSAQATRRVVRVALDPVLGSIRVLSDLSTAEAELGGGVVPSDQRVGPWPGFLGETTVAVDETDCAKTRLDDGGEAALVVVGVGQVNGRRRVVDEREVPGGVVGVRGLSEAGRAAVVSPGVNAPSGR